MNQAAEGAQLRQVKPLRARWARARLLVCVGSFLEEPEPDETGERSPPGKVTDQSPAKWVLRGTPWLDCRKPWRPRSAAPMGRRPQLGGSPLCLWKVLGESSPSGPSARPSPRSPTEALGDEPFQILFPPYYTSDYKLGFKPHIFVASRFGGQKPEIKESVGLVPVKPRGGPRPVSRLLVGILCLPGLAGTSSLSLTSCHLSVTPGSLPLPTRTPVIGVRARPKSRIISRFFT